MNSYPEKGTFQRVGSSRDSSPFLQIRSSDLDAHKKLFEERGFTELVRIFDEAALQPLSEEIYRASLPCLEPHDPGLSIQEKLRVPIRKDCPYQAWADVMNSVNSSAAFSELVQSNQVRSAFERLTDCRMVYYPITRFRALFANVKKSTYQWHQDEGVQYAMKVKELAFWNPITLWVSVNGADEGNSLELLPGSHRSTLKTHEFVDGQGHFLAKPDDVFLQKERARIVSKPGEGLFFHCLLFHRTVPTMSMIPRYSLDIRYNPEYGRKKNYKVDLMFALRRFLSKTEE